MPNLTAYKAFACPECNAEIMWDFGDAHCSAQCGWRGGRISDVTELPAITLVEFRERLEEQMKVYETNFKGFSDPMDSNYRFWRGCRRALLDILAMLPEVEGGAK